MNHEPEMLFFDLETKGDPDAGDHIEVKVPANYKDPAKIEAYVAEAKAEAISRAALDPDLGHIVAIAYKFGGEATGCLTGDENDILDSFWRLYRSSYGRVCGYNIVGFDLPFLLRRSMVWGIKPSMPVMYKKYSTFPVLDLMGVLYNWDKAKSLKWVAKRHGLVNPLPDLNGSMVEDMDLETLIAYAKNDVDLTYQLYKLMRGVYFEQ